jgi:hypothetical protein
MSNAGAGHITNYAQNENGDVWDLQQLATHMGQSVWQVRGAKCVRPVLLANLKQLTCVYLPGCCPGQMPTAWHTDN